MHTLSGRLQPSHCRCCCLLLLMLMLDCGSWSGIHRRPLCREQIVDWHLLGVSRATPRASSTTSNVRLRSSTVTVAHPFSGRCQRQNEIKQLQWNSRNSLDCPMSALLVDGQCLADSSRNYFDSVDKSQMLVSLSPCDWLVMNIDLTSGQRRHVVIEMSVCELFCHDGNRNPAFL